MGKKWVALFLIGLGFFLIVFGLGYAIYAQKENTSGTSLLPLAVVGLPLGDEITGSSAVNELTWMHGQDIQIQEAAVGTYGGQDEIIIYAARMGAASTTEQTITAMRDKIATVDSPFKPVSEREIDQRVVYELDGMGQKHFYFSSDQSIIWLTVEAGISEVALGEVLRFYP